MISKKSIMEKFDEYEDSSESEAASPAISATSKIKKHDV